MLKIPAIGFANSRTRHNGRLDIQADWIEASVLFGADTGEVSLIDVVTALKANNSYASQDFAIEWVLNVFKELERRFLLLGDGAALERKGERIRRRLEWRSRPAYAFCLALAMQPYYRKEVIAKCGASYVVQGELFERLSEEALCALNWKVSAVGWSCKAAQSIQDKVNTLAAAIGEPSLKGAVGRWTRPQAKDAGLDLVTWNGFADNWAGRPICLVQCASGDDWEEKLHTPNLSTWEKLIDFGTKPKRGLAMPFALEADEFRRKANTDDVILLMDRHRLLEPTRKSGAALPSSELATKLIAWTESRVAAFPSDAS